MNVAIIAAAGEGKRFGAGRAKQFLELAGAPVIVHTLRRFEECSAIHEVVVVLPAADAGREFVALAGKYGLRKVSRVVAGGSTRAESVLRGLQAIRPVTARVVAVHDGVRPLVTAEEIARTVLAAEESGAAVLASPVVDTIKEVQDEKVVRTLERARLYRALTPQCFHYSLLRKAYEEAGASAHEATDDSAIVERMGVAISIVEGDPRNIKITRPEDIALAEIILKQMSDAKC